MIKRTLGPRRNNLTFGPATFLKSDQRVDQPITGFHLDQHQDWVAELACGHNQHVRHNPPWTLRSWVLSEAGRINKQGKHLACKKCDAGAPPDRPEVDKT